MARTDPAINLRIPADLKERVALEAAAAGRSTNAEIVHRLSTWQADMRPESGKRQAALDALLEAVEEVLRWAEHLENSPDDADVQGWLKDALEDLELWHGRWKKLDSAR